MIDLLFLTKNRLEFAKTSWNSIRRNTDWFLVRKVWFCDDRSTEDGMNDFLADAAYDLSSRDGVSTEHLHHPPQHANGFGAPAAVMNHFVRIMANEGVGVFAKIDSDAVLPPGWLNAALDVMERHPELDLLGLEPPASRTPHHGVQKVRMPIPEIEGPFHRHGDCSGYASARSIGGIGLMRTKCFLVPRMKLLFTEGRKREIFPLDLSGDLDALVPHSIYGGFTEWQYKTPGVVKGWIVPPIDMFLLDRMPVEPFVSLSVEYERKGWQRFWSRYPLDCRLWEWWEAENPGFLGRKRA